MQNNESKNNINKDNSNKKPEKNIDCINVSRIMREVELFQNYKKNLRKKDNLS